MAKQQSAVKPVEGEIMETTETKTAKAEAKQRKMLTPAERVAKLEAELAEARAKAEAKANKAKAEAKEKRAKLLAKVDDLSEQIIALDKIIGDDGIDEAEHLAREGKD
jgi:hypothetical protein